MGDVWDLNLRKIPLYLLHQHPYQFFFCFIDRASLYELVNKLNLVHSLFLVYLFIVYLSISTCFGQLCAHHQEKQLCLCNTWYLLFCVDDCWVCRYQVLHKHSCFSWWWAHSHLKHVETDKYTMNKYTKNKLCTKLAYLKKKIPYQAIIPPTRGSYIQGGSNMTGDFLHLFTHKSVPVIFEPPCSCKIKYVPWTYPV